MDRFKKLYILLGILFVACAATFMVIRTEEHKEQIKNSGEIILELPSESVQAFSWEYKGESLAFHKQETWLYDADEHFPVSEEKVRELLEPFQAFGASFVIEDVEDFGQYGLDTPICTISLSTEEQSFEIKLGDYSKMDSERYISIGDGNVYLAQHDPLDVFDAALSDMIALDETPAFDHVSVIQFSGAQSYRITYEEESPGSYCADDVYYTTQDSKSRPLDSSKVDRYLQCITDLNPVEYVSYNVTDEELQAYGLDTPELTITVDYTTEGEGGAKALESFVLYISPDPDEKKEAKEADETDPDAEISAYIRIGESQIVYKISPENYRKLTAVSYNDLRHSEVFWADFSDIQQIDVSLEGNLYSLVPEKGRKGKEERTWLYQEEEVEIAGLRNALNALYADEFTGETPAEKEEIRLTVYLDHENFPNSQIELYRYDKTHCLAVVDGESVSLVERTAVVDLIEAIYAIVLD
ncbi:MAG: DUF4340 domain-containing protein [Lachnospiraceae bacterium]|nr:DUF4340 domain-containing protein [Lachnospiraceae bacterium]